MRYATSIPMILCLGALGQTGPGGVGATASNMLWLRADLGVTTVGSAVTGWSDRSGNANNATSPSVASRPTLAAGALNGYPVITFDGVDDELRIPDAATLDLNQWHMFMVGREIVPGNNNCWFSKGTSTQPNYGMWSPMNGAVQMPIYDILGNLNAPSAPAATTDANFNVIEYSNRVLLFLFPSRTLYKNATSVYTDASLLQLPAQNGNQFYLGDTQDLTGWNLDGSLAEVIFFNATLSAPQRIIVDNYLAAKYGLTLSSSDLYVQDLAGNGNFDHDVAGIGRVGAAVHNDSRGTGIVQINTPSNLDAGEFLFWGHDNGVLGTWGITDFPPTVQGRLGRVWRVSEVNTSNAAIDVGTVNITFDLAGLGPVTAAQLRLLVDTDNDGVFADEVPLAGATHAGGTLYRFTGVSALVNNRRFTLATTDLVNTPLPIELIGFEAEQHGADAVRLAWSTASESNSSHFVVNRSNDAVSWLPIGTLAAAGNSTERVDYYFDDRQPLMGASFYRLQMVDADSSSAWSDIEAMNRLSDGPVPVLYPNPTNGKVSIGFGSAPGAKVDAELIDLSGRVLRNWSMPAEPVLSLEVGDVRNGLHVLRVKASGRSWTIPVEVQQ